MVDDLLRSALNLGVAALHRVKVQLGRIGPRGHGAGRTAAHADAHAGAAQLDQQRARREFNLLRLARINRAQATRNHDGLVIAPADAVHVAGDGLLVLAEITRQAGAAKFIVKSRAAQWPLGHDLQRAGNVIGLAEIATP